MSRTRASRRTVWAVASAVAVTTAVSASGPVPIADAGGRGGSVGVVGAAVPGVSVYGSWPVLTGDVPLALRPIVDAVPSDGSGHGAGGLDAAQGVPAEVGAVPTVALRAYRAAAQLVAGDDPTCGLDWALLAGIGRVESNHGRYGGARLGDDGVSQPRIIGIALDGRPGVARILDTDGGALDGDTTFDRAVGPMQFIPGTWSRSGTDGDGDGRRDPHDLDDAALSAARYLCGGDSSVSDQAGARAALLRYNHSDAYGVRVLGLAETYRLAGLGRRSGPRRGTTGRRAGPDSWSRWPARTARRRHATRVGHTRHRPRSDAGSGLAAGRVAGAELRSVAAPG